ncbi:type II toxin-antitoxin system prevent-host-death family antitoxin [Candidatus Finniella inopinata]|uniref:Antitoxin n=1 Tax=Candidatus Finniella inopinata TaxID=1696036 RepID=A0A4Q7DGX2_9PROT|nr:type II toxin-antitoxin system prevent-host-death family antitoxin [Candidatus Finniella inopinata]RZI45124.1 type II toxin-antitoxin system prevent-host-death family antitoxin [Candidatus Finniella inopinata]
MHISATHLNKKPGAVLDAAMKGPVVIEKAGRSFAVMVSYERYVELEDAYWGNLAESAEKTAQWMSPDESLKFLTDE